MAMQQDSSSPTGISHDTPRGNTEVYRAIERKGKAALALHMRSDEHRTWDEIAEILGYPSGRAALVATELALEKELSTEESRGMLRRFAAERYDKMLASVIERAVDKEHGDQFAAQNQALKIIAADRKLRGYDAPEEFVVNNPSGAQLEAWVTERLAQGTSHVPEADVFGGDIVEGEVLEDQPAAT